MLRRLDWIGLLLIGYWLTIFASTHVPMPPPAIAKERHLPLDKVAHFGAYFILATLAAIALAQARVLRWPHYLLLFLLIAAYGIVDEWTQSFIPRRECDLWDWFADLGGCGLALVAFAVWNRFRTRPQSADPHAAT